MAEDSRLLLLANEAGEVPLISALVQDAIVRAADVAYDRRGRRLVLLLDRYRWEASGRTRIRSALRVESVIAVQRRDWRGALLDLLALTVDGDTVTLAFAAGPALRVQVECIDLVLEDLSAPWPAGREPAHA